MYQLCMLVVTFTCVLSVTVGRVIGNCGGYIGMGNPGYMPGFIPVPRNSGCPLEPPLA